MSAFDYKALAERVAQRAIYADNNADPNNKAWAADLRAVVSLLNGMADAQPVAWMSAESDGRLLGGGNGSRGTVPVHCNQSHVSTIPLYTHPPVTPQAASGERRVYMPVESGGICPSPTAYYPVELAPAAPQAEPCIGNDPACPCQDGDACHYKDGADGTKAWSVPQAEPKRDWSAIDAAICEYLDGYELIGENDAGADACYTPTERECDLIYDAINGLLADEHFMRLIAPHPAPAAPQAETKRKPACLWSSADDDTDVWETGCGHAFMIIDGTPGDNHMEFCCYCGRPLEQEIGGSDE